MAESGPSRILISACLNVRFGEDRTLGDQREGLNLELHIILTARPRYQDLAIYMQPTRKPRFYEAFCVWGPARRRRLWTSALPSEADIQLILVKGAASDPKRTSLAGHRIAIELLYLGHLQ